MRALLHASGLSKVAAAQPGKSQDAPHVFLEFEHNCIGIKPEKTLKAWEQMPTKMVFHSFWTPKILATAMLEYHLKFRPPAEPPSGTESKACILTLSSQKADQSTIPSHITT